MSAPKLPPLPEPSWPFGCKYNEKDMQAYALAAIAAQTVPEIDYEALIAAAYKRDRKWAQGTNGCIAFKCGAEWFRAQAIAAAPPAPQTNNPKEQS